MERKLRTILADDLQKQIDMLKIDYKEYSKRGDIIYQIAGDIDAKMDNLKTQILRLNSSDSWTKKWSVKHVSIYYIKSECKEFYDLLDELKKFDVITTRDNKNLARILDNLMPRLKKFRKGLK